MTRTRFALGAMVAASAATISLFGGVFARGSANGEAATPEAAPASTPPVALGRSPAASQDTLGAIAALQARLRAKPRDVQALLELGLAYQQRARETADPSYYPKSEGLLLRARRLAPNSPLALSGLGSLALSRHRFREALRLGRDALAQQADEARHWGVLGDALVELGRYPAAFHAFDRMAALRPDASSYARVSYARELIGDVRGAIAAMRLAVDAAGSDPEPSAWTRVQLGKLYWATGRTAAAARQYRLALSVFPGYVYALDGLAAVQAALGHRTTAIALERRAVDGVPLPQFVSQLGDLYAADGNRELAREQYRLIDVIQRLFVANGVRVDLELALFYADHGLARRALPLARAAYRDRPSIDSSDVLAWALARTGRCAEALAYSRRALRLGTRDALKDFHRGMIERCLGRRTDARAWFRHAVALNEHFSVLWGPRATREAR